MIVERWEFSKIYHGFYERDGEGNQEWLRLPSPNQYLLGVISQQPLTHK
jgi:hypothetical protein